LQVQQIQKYRLEPNFLLPFVFLPFTLFFSLSFLFPPSFSKEVRGGFLNPSFISLYKREKLQIKSPCIPLCERGKQKNAKGERKEEDKIGKKI